MLPKRVLRRRRRAPIAPRKADLRRSCTTRQRRARPLMSSTLHTDPIGHPLQPVAWILPPFPPKSGGRAGEGGQTVKGADREGGKTARGQDNRAPRDEMRPVLSRFRGEESAPRFSLLPSPEIGGKGRGRGADRGQR